MLGRFGAGGKCALLLLERGCANGLQLLVDVCEAGAEARERNACGVEGFCAAGWKFGYARGRLLRGRVLAQGFDLRDQFREAFGEQFLAFVV